MPSLRPARRRHRLLLRVIVGATLVVAAVVATLVLRPVPAAYVPGAPIEGLTDDLARDLPPGAPAVRFVDAAAAAGVVFQHFHGSRSQQLPEDMGSGAAWCDVDADGDLDLFVVDEAGPLTERGSWPASPAHNALFRNAGDGTFGEVAAAAGLDRRGCGQGAAFGDYDADGRPDLAVSEYGPLLLYQNADGQRFDDVSAATAVDAAGESFWSGLSWADYDRDGDLDLYACAYVDYHHDAELSAAKSRQYDTVIPASLNPSTYAPLANALWRNDADAGGRRRFTEVAVAAGVANDAGRSLSATFSDIDADGWLDLYVANDLSDNVLYRSAGDGTFADISHAAWVADYRGAMGLAAGDWDGDGDEDLFLSNWIAQENALFSNMTGDFRSAGAHSDGMRFMDTADQFGLGQVALDFVGWGAGFFDHDGDGRLDLLLVNGSTFEDPADSRHLVPMRPQLFWNAGPRDGFYDLGGHAGDPFTREAVARGLALADYDADGDVDAFVNVNGGRAMLLRHQGHTNHWLAVGLDPPAAWPGATIRVVAGGRTQRRQAGTGSSYLSQHAVGEEVFGVGQAARIDTLEVVWPDGGRTRRTDLAVNQRLRLAPESGGRGQGGRG